MIAKVRNALCTNLIFISSWAHKSLESAWSQETQCLWMWKQKHSNESHRIKILCVKNNENYEWVYQMPPIRRSLDKFIMWFCPWWNKSDNNLVMSKRAGNDHSSGQHLLETLWAYEDWKAEKNIESDADFVAKAESLRRRQGELIVSTNPNQNSGPSLGLFQEPDTSSATPASSGDSSQTQCVVCMSSPREITFIPCGHLAVCQQCYSRLQQCPVSVAHSLGVPFVPSCPDLNLKELLVNRNFLNFS